MRHLITGGAGFIGSHLADALTARGDSVVILDDLSTGRRANVEHLLDAGTAEFVEGSVLDADLVDDCMQAVDSCMHLASAVGVELVVGKPLDTLLTNVRGNDVVISTAARRRKRLLFTSTSEIYGKNGGVALREDSDRILGSPFKARWAYSTAKAFGEALVHSHCLETGADMVVVRLFNTVGPRQTGAYGMVLPRFVQQALAGRDLTVYGDGSQSRCFVHVLDTVQAILDVFDRPSASGHVYNVGSTDEVRIVDLARMVIERAGSEARVEFVPYEDAYGDEFEELGRRKPDTSAIEQLTGWKPRRRLEQTIDDVIAYETAAARVQAGRNGSRGDLFAELRQRIRPGRNRIARRSRQRGR